MRLNSAQSIWQSAFATILVVLLALGSTLQAQAAASHPDRAVAQMQLAEADGQHADCCTETKGGEHARHASCGTCVLPCMTALHALMDSPVAALLVGTSAHHGLGGQVAAGLSTAPDLRPPKARS